MRSIGSITDSSQAHRFGDYLTSIDIVNTIEQGTSGFSVWVHDDDQLDRAKVELSAFEINSSDPKYIDSTKVARQRVADQELRQRALQRNYIDYRTRFASMARRPAPVTIALAVVCIVVALLTKFGEDHGEIFNALCFGRLTPAQLQAAADNETRQQVREYLGRSRRSSSHAFQLFPPGSEDIRHGQLWRLFTPMFLHFGVIHILFNMLWLFDLGTAIERQRGTFVLIAIVLVSALLGNVAQFYWAGPVFGGMSGVVYGLFGYIWIKSIVQPQMGFALSKNTITIMLGWLVLCMTGMMGSVGNAAHLFGLIAGMVMAHAPYSWKKMRRAMVTRNST